MSVYFKTSKNQTTIDLDKIPEEIFPSLYQRTAEEVFFEFYVNLRLS